MVMRRIRRMRRRTRTTHQYGQMYALPASDTGTAHISFISGNSICTVCLTYEALGYPTPGCLPYNYENNYETSL